MGGGAPDNLSLVDARTQWRTLLILVVSLALVGLAPLLDDALLLVHSLCLRGHLTLCRGALSTLLGAAGRRFRGLYLGAGALLRALLAVRHPSPLDEM